MKKLTVSLFAVALLFSGVPLTTHAATEPTCSLYTITPNKSALRGEDGTVSVVPGNWLIIAWGSNNASSATADGKVVPVNGSTFFVPTQSANYSYTFSNGSVSTTCAVMVQVGSTAVATPTNDTEGTVSVRSTSSRPTLSGTIEDTKSVRVEVTKEGSSKKVFSKKNVRVRDDEWRTRVSKKLADGTYTVNVYGGSNKKDLVATDTFTIGDEPEAATNAESLSVSLLPLLMGGTARAGQSVPVSYLKVVNTGKENATLTGIRLSQRGTASTDAIAQLTIKDDKDGSQGSSAQMPFKNGSALVPTNSIFAPGQMKLFTIRALLGSNANSNIGRTLMLDVAGTEGGAKGNFPIRGTSFTISY